MKKFYTISLLAIAFILVISLLVDIQAQSPPAGFSLYEKDKGPALKCTDGCAKIVIINPGSMLGKVVNGTIKIDDTYYLSAKNGTYSTYNISPGEHQVTLLSGITAPYDLGKPTYDKLMDCKDRESFNKLKLLPNQIFSNREEIIKWMEENEPKILIDNDISIYTLDEKKQQVIIERKFRTEQLNRSFGKNEQFSRAIPNMKLLKHVFDYVTYTENFEKGTTRYFMTINREFICGPILREVSEDEFKKVIAGNDAKEGEEIWGKIKEETKK